MLIHFAASPPEFLFLTPDEWEGVRNWLATIGGLVALSIGLSTYLRNVRNKREEQARLVYSQLFSLSDYEPGEMFLVDANDEAVSVHAPGTEFVDAYDGRSRNRLYGKTVGATNQAVVSVHNKSKELIGPVRVHLVKADDQLWEEFSIQVALIGPETELRLGFSWPNEAHPGQPAVGTTIAFRDSSGQWWRRFRSEPIERIYNDPGATGMRPAELERTNADLIARGFDPLPAEKLSFSIHRRRLWRRIQGKPPVP